MWVDGIIVIIVVFAIIQGYRRGFVHTFIHTVGWILAVVLGFVWYPHVIGFLKEKTGFYDSIHGKISERIAEKTANTAESALTGIPDVIRDLLDRAVDSATSVIADSISISLTNLIFNILGFLTVVLAIKLFLMILTILFSKEKNSGLVGAMDGFLGLLAGAVKGIILIYILLALMVPITSLSEGAFLIGQLDGSVLGSYLYDNNLVLKMVKGFL